MSRIVFAGTPDFALASLKALVEAGRKPVAVLTQPDRPAGRGKKLRASPVKEYALEQEIPVLQPQTLRDADAVAELEALQPDLMIVAAYGLILPQDVLDIPTHGCINVHASVLPRWRGAAPIQAAILAGDTATGISIMQMEAGLDTGPVFSIEMLEIGATETAGELHDRLATLGGETLVSRLDAILAGALEPEVQDEAQATYAPKIEKHDAEIDWSLSAKEVVRRVRAYNPFPGAFCFVEDKLSGDGTRLKIWRATPLDGAGTAGTILQADRDAIVVACRDGAVQLEELQLPGKRRVPAHEFVGQLDLTGMRLD